MKDFMAVTRIIWIWMILCGLARCQRPASVNIGAVFTFDSVIGKVAKVAVKMAVDDVNADPQVLNGTKLNLIMEDASCNVFLGSIGAFRALEQGVAAIIGPQSSSIAHAISQITDGLQVPQVSYAATDPTLSSLQFPFFFRSIPSDSEQMAAVADLIEFYGWKEVISVYLDDDYGRNGISSLDDELEKRRIRMPHKLPISIKFDLNEITNLLNHSKVFGPRVYVVHVNPDPRLRIFSIAYKLKMMSSEFVWLATDSLSATLDSFTPQNHSSLSVVQGVVALRPHIPDSPQKRSFVSQWTKMQNESTASIGLNHYGFFAYDTIWTVAHSIDKFIEIHKNITFSVNNNSGLLNIEAADMLLDKLKLFTGGSDLINILLQSNYTGVSGRFQFSPDRNIVSSGYEIINIYQTEITRVGYWSNDSGLSVAPPETLKKKGHGRVPQDQKLNKITWPGGMTGRPRGWVIADHARPLRIGVPKRASFVEFVTELPGSHQIQGYCIDIFKKALEFVPYDVPYVFMPFGNGQSNPNYDALVNMVADNVFDAVVGDITIVTNRTRVADFSQPFASTASFIVIGVVIWILEHRINDDFRGPPKRQIVTMCMFSFSTLFKTNQENTVSTLSRMVMIVWLFLLMVITASYTANLTSILTVEQLSSPITGIDSLIATNWPIGYQVGSFAFNYLRQNFNVPKSRLVALGNPEEYARALQLGPSRGGVAAIVDELPYIELFLSTQTDFGIIGQQFSKSSWGFAFQRESPLAFDMSTAILKLSEDGELRRIRERWFCKMGCPEERKSDSEPNRLHLTSFWGLYLTCGVVTLASFLEEAIKKMFTHCENPEQQPT
ncbi:hypothetical protein K1719_042710 [Acacia pycnantha]|nr:hypothetical protein K1719_042710 [Acacia pycnantha]